MYMEILLAEEKENFIKYAQTKWFEYERWFIAESKTFNRLFSLMNNYDIIMALYKNEDVLLHSLIKKKCDPVELKTLLDAYCEEINNYSKKKFNDFGISYETAINELGYKETKRNIDEDTIDFIKRVDQKVIDGLNDESNDTIESYLYLYLSYKFRDRTFNQNNIQGIYNDLDYGLISIDDKRIIAQYSKHICSPPRIYDTNLDKTIYIDIPQSLLNIFICLYNDKKISNLSFRGINHLVFSGRISSEQLLESKYTGKLFSYEVNKLPKISMFHDENYNNKLIIVHKNNNIYVEEVKNSYYPNRDYIETQLIHIEYDETCTYITHLDHEYVFYSIKEFQEKEIKLDKEGTYKQRYKTFKLDNCTIPIDYLCESYKTVDKKTENIKIPFIYCVINELFDQKDLIEEYFKQIIQ